MASINLRELYPEYDLDCFVDVEDDDAEAFIAAMTKKFADVYVEFQRAENAFQRQKYYHNAHYSLNIGDGIESDALYHSPSPEELFFDKYTRGQLGEVIATLPPLQWRRVKAYFNQGMTYQAIADDEGVDERAIRASVKRALLTMKNYFKNSF